MEEYYRKTALHNLEIGEKFLFENTLFELIYNEHAIMVGLTIEKFEHNGSNQRQVMSFKDDQEVLIKIKQPIDNG